MEEKEITVSSLSQKTITPKPGATWKAFTVYQIQGNDGHTYETTDLNYYKSLAMGQLVKIKFNTEAKNVGGRIYTSYKIASDKPDKNLESTVRIIEAIDKMGKAILEGVRLMLEPKPRLAEHEDYMEVGEEDDEPKF